MKNVKNWIIKNWLTVIMHAMFWITYRMYVEKVNELALIIMYVLTVAVARTEGGYKESFKTDFYFKQCMKHLNEKLNKK